jgi:anti-sigma B factor antagonist
MTIDERIVGDVTVLDMDGSLLSTDTSLLKDKVNSLIAQNRTRIVVNLAKVAHIDSSGLGQLVTSFSTVSRHGGQLKLLNLTKRNKDLLSITRLVTVFETFDSETEAVQSFGAGAIV